MGFKDKTYLILLSLILFSIFVISTGQNYLNANSENVDTGDKRIKIVWCTVSKAEQIKCGNFSNANERDRFRVGYDYFKIECYRASDKDECMRLLDEGKATLTTLDAGQVFLGGRYNSLVPIAQEVYPGNQQYYYSVAAIKKGSLNEVHSLYDLKGHRACFAGVETFAGWAVPIYTLMTQGGLDIIDCNNHVKSATKYFGPSCAVNSLTDRFNPIGDNSDRLCQLCIGRIPGGRCTSSDPYAGYEGAFRCLQEVGEIAFLKHTTIAELVEGHEFISISKDSYELLCKDGSRRPVDAYESCNWGRVPTDAVVTSSATSFEQRKQYQLFLQKVARRYTGKVNYTSQYPVYYNERTPDNEQIGYTVNDPNRFNQDYGSNDRNRFNQGNQQQDYYQYGGRPSRYKRQNFGSFDDKSRPQYDQNDYNRNNNRQSDYNQNNNRQNDYNQNNNRQDDYNRGDGKRPFQPDLEPVFSGEYGHNIDPYGDNRKDNRDQYYPPDDAYDNRPYANDSLYEEFKLFQSRYGLNLLFQDSTIDLAPLNENLQTYTSFLGGALNIIMGVRDCPVRKMTLCVTSDVEQDKCVKMKTALKAQLLKPEMECYKAHSQINCMQAIRSGTADVTVLDPSDVYTAGLNFDLIPFISEVYNLNEPENYVVAVAKESDPSTELTYLKGKYTCHGGINTAAGWVYPLAFLISNGWIRPYGCNSIRAAAEYFSKSCAPGAISTEYNTGVPYDNMCDLCHGASFRYCRRDASEDYYGHTGAFRCLVEGGGQVAFVTHTTVTQNTGGKREEWWARDNLNDDFELLCPDGTRAEVNEFEKCNLGKIKANAIVTRGGYGYNETSLNAFINLFLYAQTFYGRRTTDEFSFSMFSSKPPYTDLIFQDATTQLKVIHPTKRHYAVYLGNDFLRARRIVDCHAGSASISASIVAVIIAFVLVTVKI